MDTETDATSQVSLPDGDETQPLTDAEPTSTEGGEAQDGVAEEPEKGAAGDEAKERVYTKAEVAKIQSTLDQQNAELQQRVRQLEQSQQVNQMLQGRFAEIAQAEKDDLESVGDTPQIRAFYEKQRQAAYADVARFQADELRAIQMKDIEAHNLSVEHGVDKTELLSANTRGEMLALALRLKAEKTLEGLQEASRKPQDLSTPSPGGGGTNWRGMSPDEKLQEGLKRLNRKKSS